MNPYFDYNGELTSSKQILSLDDMGYRYGYGVFETMKMVKEKIPLKQLHFERLFSGTKQLQLKLPAFFTEEYFTGVMKKVAEKNNSSELARIRLSISGSKNFSNDKGTANYLVECQPLDNSINQLNEKGLGIDIYHDARKTCDAFANLKSMNYLPYLIAAKFAKDNQLDDCLVLNSNERICDSSIANVFWIKNKIIFTPPLSEGCIAGVMRRYLLQELRKTYKVQEKSLTVEELKEADEVFLTNAIKGIRWVRQFKNIIYVNTLTKEIYKTFPLL